jgi:Caspase domain
MLRWSARLGLLLTVPQLLACASAGPPSEQEALFDAARACAKQQPWIGVRRGFDGKPEFYFTNDRDARMAPLAAARQCYAQATRGVAPPTSGSFATTQPSPSGTPATPPPVGAGPSVATASAKPSEPQSVGPASGATARPSPGIRPAEAASAPSPPSPPPAPANGPVIVVAAPADGDRLSTDRVRLVAAVAAPQGVARVEVDVNGNPLPVAVRDIAVRPAQAAPEGSIAIAPTTLDVAENVPLVEGANRIVLRVIDRTGASVSRTLTVTHRVDHGRLFSVVIGISRYRSIRPLAYADRDAAAMRDYLVQVLGVPPENMTVLLNEQATLVNIKRVLGTDLRRRAGEKDTVIIYYAGHGAPEPDATSADGDGLEKYLVPYDADANDLYTTALPMREIETILTRLASERVVFITDTCYSGATAGRTFATASRRAVVSEAFLSRLASARGRIVLTASRGSEVSEERDDLKHGVFTYYLLEGLRGAADSDGDGIVTVDEAYGYVARKVPEVTGQNQHPQKKGEVEGQLAIGRVSR